MNEIENQLNRLAMRSPSVQYYYFDADHILFSYKKGFANKLKNQPINKHTTYNTFSVTKTFTALAVLLLAEQGKIDINKSFRSYMHDFPYGNHITIKQVLNHSSGIPNPIPLNWIHLTSEHNSFNHDLFFEHIFKTNKQLKFKPNEKYLYTNLGYVLLGQLIEKISGVTYEHFIKENIIQKLNLNESDLSFTIPNETNHATGYHKQWSFTNLILGLLINKSKFTDKAVKGWKPFRNFYINGISYGGLIGKPTSFVVYIQELLKDTSPIIPNKIKKQLFEENITNTGNKTGMCLSWFKGALNGEIYYAHAGGGGAYYCEIRIYPNSGKGSVIFFNRSGMTDERVLNKLDQYHINQ